MIIQEIHVKNFRSILNESLPCDSLTALVGRNGSGKSSFLSALELFYNPSAGITPQDFYAEDVTQDIEIAVTFAHLSADAKDLFSLYVNNDTLTVVRVFSNSPGNKSGIYHGMHLQNPDFQVVRNAGGAMDMRRQYAEIRKEEKYSSLPTVTPVKAVREALANWERRNPGQCSRLRDDGQFFGFKQVAQGFLGRHTRFIHIPAVRDAQDDATENRGSSVTEIMDLVVRSVLAMRTDIADFKRNTQDQYTEIMDPAKLTELKDLEHRLSTTLQSYVPDANVRLRWSELADIQIPMPEAEVRLREDNYESTVERTGHGLQRAFIVTMLQHLVAAREAENRSADETSQDDTNREDRNTYLPSLVLAIEEPELYQHPSRQRHLASVFLDLATGTIPGVAEKTQVVFTTHSPLFVGLDNFQYIRVLRKVVATSGKPKFTRVRETDMDVVAHELWTARDSKGEMYTETTLHPRLQAIMTPWTNEGFFADTVVLVEGEADRAAILGVAQSMNHDFDGQGITIIPCFGKNNLDRPLVIFREFDIPVYVIWDGDHKGSSSDIKSNKYLLRLLHKDEEEWPNFISDSCACFKSNLEATLEKELGKALFAQLLESAQKELNIIRRDDALKNAAVIQRVIENAGRNGNASESLESIVKSIISLRAQSEA